MKTIHHLLAVLFILSIITGCGEEQKTKVSAEVPVKVTQPVKRELAIPVRTSGILSYPEEIKLSFKTGGIIKSINAEEGTKVKKGALLATLDTEEIEASVSKAKAAYEKAQRDAERVENLYADSAVTKEQLQNSKTALEAAEADYTAARYNLRHSSITAPSGGRILRKLAEENELVGSGTPVILFASSSSGWVIRNGLSAGDIIRIAEGDSASVTLDIRPGKKLEAKVTETAASADPRNGTFETELTLLASPDEGFSGLTAKAEIFPAGKTEFMILPTVSMAEAKGNTATIYVLRNDSTVVSREIALAGLLDGNMLVSGGLNGSETVVTEGAQYLSDGIKVSIKD